MVREIKESRDFMKRVMEHESDAVVSALEQIYLELNRAKHHHPDWPDDPIHQAAIVSEEAGELIRAGLQEVYEAGDSREHMQKEAVQTGAMALRFLVEKASK